ncbi:MAG: nucleoside 2-deoxyribosyltransferase [Thermoguttaceae bacterium]
MNVYFAGPLFTLAERHFNEELSAEMRRLCPTLDIFFPQTCDKEFQGLPDFAQRVYHCLLEALDRCDAVVAILDGPDTDSGTCIEIGYARAKNKPVIGVRTDFRDGEVHGLNIMTAGICSSLIKLPSTSTSITEVAENVVKALDGTANP